MNAAEQRAALEAAGQLALECGEFTWDPDAEPDEDDIEALIELGAIEFYNGAPDTPLQFVDSVRPATRPPELADKYSSLHRIRGIDILPPLDDYQPPTTT
ncbi:hypothetical protein [Streptomyces zaomyceticus]|uniref:hypothetical protein n=1 Tax=Streptomyces zaomyceticus TaxID=68286 RepID=UPI002E1612AB|nr:hypothetical protein OG237_15770 [Streptomyces zaomyceticus]